MRQQKSLTNANWASIQKVLAKFPKGRPSTLGDRLFIDAVLWRFTTGNPWRSMHKRFGNWKTVYNRFREWDEKGIWRAIVREISPTRR